MKSLALIALACALHVIPHSAAASDAEALSRSTGTFASTAPEPWYNGYGFREFVFRDGTWSLTFTHAIDPQMTLRTFQFRTGGTYRVGDPSRDLPGAFRTTFDEDWKHVTLLSFDQKLISAMGMASCALTPNLETDISATGCAAWKPVADCGQDHDLMALDDSGLRFGVRPADNDMCTEDRTPTALLPPVVAR
jgi:hypothetical protein